MMETEQATPQALWAAQCAAFAQDAGAADWLQRLRRRGAERFAALRFPSRREAAWGHTDLAPLTAHRFVTAPAPRPGADPDLVARLAALPRLGTRVVFVDGHLAPELGDVAADPACRVLSLAAARADDAPALRGYLGHTAGHEVHAFNALNTAYLSDGAFVTLAPGAHAAPLELVFIAHGAAAQCMAHPRVVVVAEAGSHGSVVERYVGCGARPALVNGVTELFLGEGAQLTHTVLQEQAPTTTHLGQLHARLAAGARLVSTTLAAGGGLARHEAHVRLLAPDADCTLRGVALGAEREQRDMQARVAHEAARCASLQDFRSVLNDHAVGVFFGAVHVLPQAQGTRARQLSKNLLLAPQACAHTRPQLEILADDVKCNHGATVGALRPEALFYLRSRGIAPPVAREMLTQAFVAEVLEELPAPLRVAALDLVSRRLGALAEAA